MAKFLLVEAAAGEELAAGGEGHTVYRLLVPDGRGVLEGATCGKDSCTLYTPQM